MSLLDIRTVMFSHLVTDAVCTAVLAFLWSQNRKRFAGMFFWVVDFIFQTTAALLIILRGSIPDWMSMGLASTLVIAGALMGYLGLERFVGKRSSQVHNYILLAVFILVHFYFIFVQPDLAVRNLNISLGLLVVCFQCTWLMLRRAGSGLTRMTQIVGLVFALFCLVSLIRIFIILASPHPSNDFFQSGLYDTLILMSYQILLILLTFSLALMVNRRLLMEVKTQEEKFTRAFHSSPHAILITRLSDGLILDVNRSFEEITGYRASEAIGKTTLDLGFWVQETDRQEAVAELSAGGEVQGKEFQFRAKSGRELTGLFFAEIFVIENERLVLSSISDITGRRRAEEALVQRTTDLGERVKELKCLYGISKLIAESDKSVDVISEEAVRLIPQGWYYPEITCARIALKEQEFVTDNFRETQWKLSADIAVSGKKLGSVEVFYLEERPALGEGPFLKEERSLIDDLARKLGVMVERKWVEEQIAYQAKLLAIVNDAVVASDEQYRLTAWNAAAESIYGWKAEEVLGRFGLDITNTEFPGADKAETLRAIAERGNWRGEATQARKDGTRFPVEVSSVVLHDETGKLTGFVSVNRDITLRKQTEAEAQRLLDQAEQSRRALLSMLEDRKRAEDKIRAALEEKETLLREIHHRVKNNLQAMISLMDLQTSRVKDEQTLQFLKELEEQTRTMSLVYEQLYQSENLARVAMAPYLQKLASNVLEAFSGGRAIEISLEVAPLSLDVAQAMPCGLIVNELLTNSLKHAFPPDLDKRPAIRVRLQIHGQTCTLSVADNGIGLPSGFDGSADRTLRPALEERRSGQALGLHLVNLWATHQLGGTLDVSSDRGTSYTVKFDVTK